MARWKLATSFKVPPGLMRQRGPVVIGGVAVVSILVSVVALSGAAERIGLLVGLTLCAVLSLQVWRQRRAAPGLNASLRALFPFLEADRVPSIALSSDHELLWANSAALRAYPGLAEHGVAAALEGVSKDIAPVLRRLRRKAEPRQVAEEDLVTRHGHIRLVMRGYANGSQLLRIEPLALREDAQIAHGPIPMMSVSRSGTILSMNGALRRFLGRRARRIEEVFVTPPDAEAVSGVLRGEAGDLPALLHQRALSAGRREIALIPVPKSEAALPGKGLESLPVAVLKLSQTGEVRDSNRAARQLLSMEAGTPIPSFEDLVTGLGRSVSAWLAEAFQSHYALQPEVLRLRDAARESYLQVTLSRVEDPDGTALMAVLHDATELKTLEAQFVQSQKMQAIGQLAGGVAHDFNNLLTAISGHCDLLLLRHDQCDPDYSDLVQINQNANRAASLVGQLLAFSRKQTLQPEVLDIRDTLSDLTHLLNRLVGEKVQLTLVNEPDLAHLRADKRQLEQVLMNLVVNARDAMPDGGEIVVETASVHLAHPQTRARVTLPAGDYICVTVTDQGVGIPRDKIGKIFEPFYTTKRTGEGTGLGLSTAYGIVKQSGGFIFAESVVGKGTAFELFFPAYHQIPEESPVVVQVKDEPRSTDTANDGVVLLVEDEAPVRAFAARALRLNGFTVLEAENGEMALHLLENPSISIDLFVTDVVMPGIDGPTWVREALAARSGTPVVFMSGYAEDFLSGAEAEIPHSSFLQKPFSLKQLTAAVHARLGADRTGEAQVAQPSPEVA